MKLMQTIPNATIGRAWHRFYFTLSVLLAFASAGCRGDRSRDDRPEEEHIGHVIPAHKPKDFPVAVRKLRELNRAIDAGIARGQMKALNDDRTLPIALDIATWLPEIAADSDMPEAPWNTVNARSESLVAAYKSLLDGANSPGADPSRAAKEADGSVSALEGLLAEAGPSWFEDGVRRDNPPK
jgi:hypothetical protein